MKLYPFIRGGIMNINKENYCPVCHKEFTVKIEDRFGFDVPILIIKCDHDEKIFNYLFEERAENHERRK